MISHRWIFVGLLIGSAAFAAEQASQQHPESKVVFREPFKLEIPVDKDRVWTESFDRVPYFYENGVYLFPDEKFGAKLEIKNGVVIGVSYLADAEKADVSFELSQQLEGDRVVAKLTLRNRSPHTLTMRALMMVAGEKKPIPTTIVPLHSGLTNFESWPHALRQLLLYEIQIVK
jgi:hypothetical protein